MKSQKSNRRLAVVRCPNCQGMVGQDHVEEAFISRDDKQILVRWLHQCGLEGRTIMPRGSWEGLVHRWEDDYQKSQKTYDTEAVGIAVQGFRIDLDAVSTVADMALFWDDQQRRDPWSIPKERPL